MRNLTICAAFILVVLAGCSEQAPPEDTATPSEAPPAETTTTTTTARPTADAWGSGGTESPSAETDSETSPPEEETESFADTLPEGTEAVEAETGVGARGRNYGGGVISEPVRQYFRVGQRIVFDINIPHAMQVYHGLHNRTPESHEEFMQEIIEENGIALPDLPEGHEYRYDPEAIDEDTGLPGVLMVVRPSP